MQDNVIEQQNKQEMPVTGENANEASIFARLFPGESGVRFNFDDVREFLNDPLIALIATDLTVSIIFICWNLKSRDLKL